MKAPSGLQKHERMHKSKKWEAFVGIIKMVPLYCAFFLFLTMLIASLLVLPLVWPQYVSANDVLQVSSVSTGQSADTSALHYRTTIRSTPNSARYYFTALRSASTSARYYHTACYPSYSSSRYYRNSDGIWRRNCNTFSYARSRMSNHDVSPLIYNSFADPLLFSKYLTTIHSRRLNTRSAPQTGSFSLANVISNPEAEYRSETGVSQALLLFTGDIMCLRGQQYDASTKKGYNFWPSYRSVAKIFNEADFVCGNLETLLSPSNPLTKDRKITESGTPLCNGPEELLRTLKRAGYDMLVTANNHCCDYGTSGIIETKTNLDKYLFANAGTSYPPESGQTGSRFRIFDVNGFKIAVLSYTHLINQRSLLSSDELDTMVNCYDLDMVRKDISDAKAAGAEYTVVYCHWGIENTEKLTEYEIKDSENIAEAGADLIIGSHPHCLQSCRYIETADGRSVLCMYSMGNFCSSMAREINNDTIILRANLERDQSGKIISAFSYIPCHVSSYRSGSFVVIPIDRELNCGVTGHGLKEAGERIAVIMNGIIDEYTP